MRKPTETIRLLAKEAMKLESSEIGTLPKLRPFRRDKHDKAENIPESLFGAHPKMKPFSRADEAKSHEM